MGGKDGGPNCDTRNGEGRRWYVQVERKVMVPWLLPEKP